MGTSKPTVVVGSATKKTDYDAAIDFVSEPEELNGDAGITLTIANFGCCVRVNSAGGQAVALPSIGAGDVGGWFVVYQLGAGTATITRADTDNIYANGVAGTTYVMTRYEAVLIRCVALDKWAIEGAIRITDHGGLSGLADDDHSQYHNNTRGDARYFTEAEHIDASAGAGDAGKPIKLNASGYVDPTMVSAGAVDHGSLAGLADNDHPQYFMPVGVIMAWLGGYFADGSNGTYTRVLGATNDVAGANGYVNPYWHVCNGAALNDAGSPIFNGALRYLPNLTDDRFIMGATVAGGIGGSSTMAHTHNAGTYAAALHYHQAPCGHDTADKYTTRAWGYDNIAVQAYYSARGTSYTATLQWSRTDERAPAVAGTSSAASNDENRPKFLSCFYIMKVK